MKVTGAILRLAAAEVLSLFINMTFAGSGSGFIRLVCLICTVLILLAVMADYSVKAAGTDAKVSGSIRYKSVIRSAAAVTAFPLMSWTTLFFSARSGAFEFYGAHKLLNAPFLHFYNFIEPSASSSELGTGRLLAMLPPVFVPAAVLAAVYITAFRKSADEH